MKRTDKISIVILALLAVVIVAFVYTVADKKIWRDKEDGVNHSQNDTRILLSWWGNDGRHQYTMEGVDLFQEENPGIDVEYRYGVWRGYEKRNKVWMESNTEADVMQINFAWLQEYSPDGAGYYDLNLLSDVIDLDCFTEEELAYGTRNGKLNALPIAMNTHTFYYNKEILDAYGMDVPTTWEDLEKLGERAAEDDKYALGFSKKQLFLFLIAYYEQNHDKAFFNEDGTLAADEEDIEEVLVYYKKLVDGHVLCPIDSFERSKYLSGEIIGTMCWISDAKLYCDAPQEAGTDIVGGLFPMKPGAERTGWYIKPATMWAISADTEHPEEAAKLLDFLLNDEDMVRLQQTEKGVPVSDEAIRILSAEGLAETNEFKATENMFAHQEDLHLMIPNMENDDILNAFKTNADEYLYDKTDAGTCAAKIYADMQDVIASKE